jgi:hypothetical protein
VVEDDFRQLDDRLLRRGVGRGLRFSMPNRPRRLPPRLVVLHEVGLSPSSRTESVLVRHHHFGDIELGADPPKAACFRRPAANAPP